MNYSLLFLSFLVFITGCTSLPGENIGADHVFTIDVSPNDLFTSATAPRTATATMEFQNNGEIDIQDVTLEIYDIGAIAEATRLVEGETRACLHGVGVIEAGTFASRSCELTAPTTIEDDVITTEVKARATYFTTLNDAVTISAITEDEYRVRQAKGEITSSTPVFTSTDDNLQIKTSFSDDMPIIIRPDKDAFMYIDISNIGNGRIESIDSGNIHATVQSKDGIQLDCPDIGAGTTSTFKIKDRDFPRITCKITLPNNVNYLNDQTVIIEIDYKYEIRTSQQVQIRR
jgi:hypothetical protein